MPHPSDPRLYEPYVVHAGDYVALAESKNGPLPRPVDYDYIWGDALERLEQVAPDVRIINLETAVTTSDAYWPGKGINYRMHPGNLRCITSAGIDCCTLANNHVLDWGYPGLEDTLNALHAADIRSAGAGTTLKQAEAPAIIDVAGKGRVVVFAFGHGSSGIPSAWAATPSRPGIARLDDLSTSTVQRVEELVQAYKQPGDIVVTSVHWGGNWGYVVPPEQRRFARQLIDQAGVDVFHGHSSHHPKGIEVYNGKPILYGCGDLLNDYEGISGYEEYRDDLSLMYIPTLSTASGKLVGFELVPMLIRNFRLNRPPQNDVRWLEAMLNREGRPFGTGVQVNARNHLVLGWV